MRIEYVSLNTNHWPLVKDRLGLHWSTDTRGILALDCDDDDLIVAGVVLNNWAHNSVQAHIWIDNPMVIRHGLFNEVADFVFNVAQKELLLGVVPSDNEAALKLDQHIGFVEKYRIRDGYMQGIDYVILEARREDVARWLEPVREVA